jgi:4'-phosphopantetheinyl transferase
LEIDCRWSEEQCQAHLPWLPPLIRQRAARYLAPDSRRNLIATRGRLRQVLEALELDPGSVSVATNGRPYQEGQRVQFNLSHSRDRAVLALSRDPALIDGLGVDLEWVGRTVDVGAIGRRFFTAQEHAWIGSDAARFFHVWTRKEAVLKSNGVGLRVELDSFDVLTDRVADHVTGRPLTVRTAARDEGYLISWAVSSVPAEVVTLSDRESPWLERLQMALKSEGKE